MSSKFKMRFAFFPRRMPPDAARWADRSMKVEIAARSAQAPKLLLLLLALALVGLTCQVVEAVRGVPGARIIAAYLVQLFNSPPPR
jgi:hypothetical protein